MKRFNAVLLAALAACSAVGLSPVAVAQPAQASPTSPLGRWTTIDDDGKTATSVVEIQARGKKLHGKIVQLINPKEKDPRCTKCEGKRKNQPIVGMEIMWGLERDGDEWSGGYILDPDNGEEYRCYIEVVEGGKRLKVRGYVGLALLGRTQYWQREGAARE